MSSGTMVLQPIPCVPGYSQLYGVVELSFGRSVREKVGEAHSKSMPSRSSFERKVDDGLYGCGAVLRIGYRSGEEERARPATD